MFRMPHWFLVGFMCASFLIAPAASDRAELKQETLKMWDAFIQTANAQMRSRLQGPSCGLTKNRTALIAFARARFWCCPSVRRIPSPCPLA